MSNQMETRLERAPERQLRNGGEAAALVQVHFDDIDADRSKDVIVGRALLIRWANKRRRTGVSRPGH